MEIGQSVVSTEEYIRLKEIQQKYLKVTEEFEAKADQIVIVKKSLSFWGIDENKTIEFVGKDDALAILSNALADDRIIIKNLRRDPDKSLGARLRFLLTGRITQLPPLPEVKVE